MYVSHNLRTPYGDYGQYSPQKQCSPQALRGLATLFTVKMRRLWTIFTAPVLTSEVGYVHFFVQKEVSMSQSITYTKARQTLAETMNRVCDHHEPVIITRQRFPSVVMISLEDYNAIMETAYLLRSPGQCRPVAGSIATPADAGEAVQHDLED